MSIAFLLPLVMVAQSEISASVLVVGGGTGGVAAGIESARAGVPTLIVESTGLLGGMLTGGGVSCTDGNDSLPSGIWQEFREALHRHYGSMGLATGWVSETCFEPHVGDSIFKAWAGREPDLRVLYHWVFERALLSGRRVVGASFRNAQGKRLIVHARISIDATEWGDLFASAGEAYDLGTEDPAYSGEKMAPGKTAAIQDLTWVAILRDYGPGPAPDMQKPSGYDPRRYDCCCTSAPCSVGHPYPADAKRMLEYGRLPNGKFMINWPAHGNDYYFNGAELTPAARESGYALARQRTLGFVYYIRTILGYSHLALADDELNQGLAWIPYLREGRRLHGVLRFNLNQILDPYGPGGPAYRAGIAVGDYPVDQHHGANPASPRIEFPPIPSFNVPLGALIPAHVDGLIVCDKGISVSNIVNGATRLQPVVLLTGQAAGLLAALSIRDQKQPREVSVRALQQRLLDQGAFLMPYVDVLREDPAWEAIQRIGATGILRGVGKSEGWANKTFFYPDSPADGQALRLSLLEWGLHLPPGSGNRLWREDLRALAGHPAGAGSRKVLPNDDRNQKLVEAIGNAKPLTRREAALMLDYLVDLFHVRDVDPRGIPITK